MAIVNIGGDNINTESISTLKKLRMAYDQKEPGKYYIVVTLLSGKETNYQIDEGTLNELRALGYQLD